MTKIRNRNERFEFIEHTADVGVVAYGDNLADAFANAACGLFSIITDPSTVRENISHTVELTGEDMETLLFDWLNELIYLFDAKHLLFKSFDIMDLTEEGLKAVCLGERYDPGRHQLKTGVKAATYYLLRVDREKYRVQVIFDV